MRPNLLLCLGLSTIVFASDAGLATAKRDTSCPASSIPFCCKRTPYEDTEVGTRYDDDCEFTSRAAITCDKPLTGPPV
jgi:hypothetical protein